MSNKLPPLDDYSALMAEIETWERAQADFLGELLYAELKPKTIVDWGCGPGIYLVPFAGHQCEVMGIDADPFAGRALNQAYCDFSQADIRKALSLFDHYDLALCIEVAEHLQPQYADELVDNVAYSADTVFWSAAHPGQIGEHHYNCQSPEYWEEKFRERGFVRHVRDEYVREQIAANPDCQRVQWLISNARLYTRRSIPA